MKDYALDAPQSYAVYITHFHRSVGATIRLVATAPKCCCKLRRAGPSMSMANPGMRHSLCEAITW